MVIACNETRTRTAAHAAPLQRGSETMQHRIQTAPRPSSRGSAAARNDVINMLKEDHKRAKKAFRDFERMDPEEDAQDCEALVQQTCAELQVHAALEEELFYPAARGGLREEDLVEEAEVEHMTVKVLMEQLQGMSASDGKFAATFKVLGEYIKHHVKEEESEMFEQLGRARLDWEALGEAMHARRAELMDELMPDAASAQLEGGEPASQEPLAQAAKGRTPPARAGQRAGSR
jgi:hemerythrin-like domain-containing protein